MLSQDMGDSYTLHHNEQVQPTNQTLKTLFSEPVTFLYQGPLG